MDWNKFTNDDLKAAMQLESSFPVSAGRGVVRDKAVVARASRVFSGLTPSAVIRVRKANRNLPAAQVLKRTRQKLEKQIA